MEQTINGTIEALERLQNSENGNPRYLIHLKDGGSLQTKPDAMVAFEISNSEYQDVPVTLFADNEGVWDVKVSQGV